MRNKSVFLLLACVCGTIAAIGVSQWMQAQNPKQTEIALVEIFVTAKAIDVAEEITPDKIRLEQWPADRVPEGTTSKLDDLEGKFARQRFYAGEPVMPVKLMNDANGTSQTIPKGFSVVSMKADQANAVANLVRPGDRVDVMAYFRKSDVIPETTAKTVLKGIRVFAVDGRTQREEEEDGSTSASTISLLIHKNDAEAWTYASEIGKIRLTLGNPGDYGAEAGANNAGQAFLDWLADHQRALAKTAAEKAEPEPVTVPQETQTASNASPDFKMLKMSNGKLTEYKWTDGQLVPTIISESDAQTSTSSVAAPTAAETGNTDINEDYSYLNGSQSPFFQPPADEPAFAGPNDDSSGRTGE